ncbi:type II toxin-antitoxin system RatA family toxin [Acidiferrobacter sp.]|uniref:type II toxin-antitoxin system RatA family toxin n=1 Tax=Acidiferrobacter sp. TaxID=1872107 RepID=UPI00260557CF|nr:type II toxin-antitoxin system RatA family toxin [Acidiferrobacter sp.]
MTTISKSALVPYSAQEMYELVADVEGYPRFLPWCAGARVLERDESGLVADIDMAFGGVHKTFTTRNTHSPGRMDIRLVRGPFSRLEGSWRFTQVGELGSRISLDLEFDFASRLLALAVGPVFATIANSLVDSFKRRAREVYGAR